MKASKAILILGSWLVSACAVANAEDVNPTPAATSMTTCASSYSVLGKVDNGSETESIGGVVFTDASPWECTLSGPTQRVQFNFNSTATDPTTGCDYTIERELKGSSTPVSSSEELDCDESELHYGVLATPVASDPDCDGLERIDVDPKIILNRNNCGTN